MIETSEICQESISPIRLSGEIISVKRFIFSVGVVKLRPVATGWLGDP